MDDEDDRVASEEPVSGAVSAADGGNRGEVAIQPIRQSTSKSIFSSSTSESCLEIGKLILFDKSQLQPKASHESNSDEEEIA